MTSRDPELAALSELEYLRARVRELEQQERKHLFFRKRPPPGEWKVVAALTRDISLALNQSGSFTDCLQACAQALVTHLGAAFARIWTLESEAGMLDLQASAGIYTHLNGPHAHVPLGSLKIGLIASEGRPHLTNAVIGDPRVSDQEWAQREGMVAFAGFPLLIEDHVVGVMALFARFPLTTIVLDAMASIANAIALGIERRRAEEARGQLLLLEQEARAQAQEARAAAEDALQMQNEFLAAVSHDLKTPLAAISMNLQLLQRRLKRGEMLEAPALADRLAMMEASTSKTNRMIEGLLDLARLRRGLELDLDHQSVLMCTLLRQVGMEQQATSRRHEVVISTPSEEVVVLGDPLRLDRVFTNLLANAIKYSPAGGRVLAGLTREQDEMVLRVQDWGVGIPATDLPYVFEPFRRASNVARQFPGTGVGLASVSEVLAQHGGTISVTSEEGQGSTFIVRLPCMNDGSTIDTMDLSDEREPV